MKELADLFVTFAKMGLFTFGGGYAMLPLLEREVVDNKKWATKEEIMDYYAVGQCTPGIIAVNVSTFVGYYQKGIAGGIVATLGVVFPSIVIILLIASLIQGFSHIAVVQYALSGIRVAVCALIFNAIVSLSKSGVKDVYGILLFLFAFVMVGILKLSPVYVVVVSALCGLLIKKIQGGKK
ncbi:chromate transporter [Dielma fastidiosa]|uniref:chromate transporter n=1 Tax=Dielma fastidiosa TaxID=1034346 RepID=UPI00356495BD